MNTSAYIQGGIDCRKGLPHKPGMHPDYNRGYGAQYELEQVLTAQTESRRDKPKPKRKAN